jgi:hypothetical protein
MTQDDLLQIRTIGQNAHTVTGARQDYQPLMELIGDSRFVLLGEASHGTHDFYYTRAQITEWLIEEKGFGAIAVEADWPDTHRVNRYVQDRSDDASAVEALASFQRFPSCMWRNADVVEFVEWLRDYNDGFRERKRKVGFYGLDLYSLHASARAVLEFLDKVDPEAARRARYRYACFEHFGEDTQAYGYAATFDLSKSCEDAVVSQLVEMQTRASELGSRNAKLDPDTFFIAEQNARLVKNAERITGQCSRAGLTPGTFAINTWSRPLKHWSVFSVHRAKSCFGLTTLTSVTHGPPKWASVGNSMSASSSASAGGKPPCLWVLPPTAERSRRPPTGMVPQNENECGPRSAGVTNLCSPRLAFQVFCWIYEGKSGSQSSQSEAARARNRRDLCARVGASQSLLSRSPRRSVRRLDPYGSDTGNRTSGANLAVGDRRVSGDLSVCCVVQVCLLLNLTKSIGKPLYGRTKI